ncbi:MAG: hypothetical protein GY814_09845, partial [Gammaproteobacteria bacterium]|nr:hypothetical protein [Gammaproteobacteria bacterium]
ALYKELAEIGTCFEASNVVGVWEKTDMSPNLVSALSKWRVAKPVKKIIDLTKCINTIDMEFSGLEFFYGFNVHWTIGKLVAIDYPYIELGGGSFKFCRIRQNHINWYNGIGNPLPDGLLVRIYFYNKSNKAPTIYKSQDLNWDGGCLCNVSGFEVLEVLPEYKYEWEKE